jgi:hypothetical protein
MAKVKNRARNPGEPTSEIQPVADELIAVVEETVTPDIMIDEPVTEIVGFEPIVAAPVVKNTISIDPDITIVQQEPPKIVFNKGLLGDKTVELIYDMFKDREPDEELFDYLTHNAAKLVNRISPADILFWKAVIKRLDKIIDKK